jgi:hypothetical protein
LSGAKPLHCQEEALALDGVPGRLKQRQNQAHHKDDDGQRGLRIDRDAVVMIRGAAT